MKSNKIRRRIKVVVIFYMLALIISGATAIPAEAEIAVLLRITPETHFSYTLLSKVYIALHEVGEHAPFLLYGYDWLAFAHFMIAIAFTGVYKNPVRNIWVVEWGLVCCACVIPFALVAAPLRSLPWCWVAVDCSFGVFGCLPLWWCRRKIKQLEQEDKEDKLNVVF